MRYIIGFNEKDIKLKNKAGGKGKSLINLSNINLPVPKGYVVLCHAFTDGDICSEAIDELENLINRLSDNITYAVDLQLFQKMEKRLPLQVHMKLY